MTNNASELDEQWTKIGRRFLLGVIIFFGLLFAGCGALMVSGAGAGPSETSQLVTAERLCHDAVKRQLKAPTTAKFDGETASGSNGYYNISGQVSSENGFSAMIASRYTCTVSGGTATANVQE